MHYQPPLRILPLALGDGDVFIFSTASVVCVDHNNFSFRYQPKYQYCSAVCVCIHECVFCECERLWFWNLLFPLHVWALWLWIISSSRPSVSVAVIRQYSSIHWGTEVFSMIFGSFAGGFSSNEILAVVKYHLKTNINIWVIIIY